MPSSPSGRPRASRSHLRLVALTLALISALALAACGSSSSSTTTTSTTSGGSSSSTSTTPSGGASTGSGKSLTLGSKDFTEEFILGELYRQVLTHDGYQVSYKGNIGATEVIDKALTSGQIDAYPEYTGESAVTVLKINQAVSSPQQEYDLAKAAYAKRGQSMSTMTPFYDTDAIAVLKSYATKYHLATVADLKKAPHFTLGARPEFLGRYQGAAGMKKAYGVNNFTFKSLALGIQYQALDTGAVNAIDVFTTDPQLASGKYTVLKDPKNIFGFQNVALIINTTKLKQLGGAKFMSIINKVNALLTTSAMVAMNKAVAIDKQPPAAVAKAFLQANHLI